MQVYYRVRETSVIPLSFQENVMASENASQVYSVMLVYFLESVTLPYYQEKGKETHSSEIHYLEIPISHASETLSYANPSYLAEIPFHARGRETPFTHVIETRWIWMSYVPLQERGSMSGRWACRGESHWVWIDGKQLWIGVTRPWTDVTPLWKGGTPLWTGAIQLWIDAIHPWIGVTQPWTDVIHPWTGVIHPWTDAIHP
jgi:hypothetical protein